MKRAVKVIGVVVVVLTVLLLLARGVNSVLAANEAERREEDKAAWQRWLTKACQAEWVKPGGFDWQRCSPAARVLVEWNYPRIPDKFSRQEIEDAYNVELYGSTDPARQMQQYEFYRSRMPHNAPPRPPHHVEWREAPAAR